MKYRLGLDIGTNSLGWSVLKLDEEGAPDAIEAAGARIFSDGRSDKSKATLAAERREARLARRRRDRFKQRQHSLLNELENAGLFPSAGEARIKLQALNPLKLRFRALSEKLTPYEIGRALFHLNQRRGFQSNRKDKSDEKISGMVSRSARKLLEQMGLLAPLITKEALGDLSKAEKKQVGTDETHSRKQALIQLQKSPHLTYGSFLWQRQQQGEPTLSRFR